MQSVTPKTRKPAAASVHVRVSRHPESAIAATDEGEEHRVADRVGEVDGDRDRAALGGAQDCVERERGRDGRDGGRGDGAVDPDVERRAREPGAEDKREPCVGEHVEREPEGVREGRELVLVGEQERPVRVAEPPDGDAGADQRPAEPFVAARECPRGADKAHRDDCDVVRPVVEDVGRGRAHAHAQRQPRGVGGKQCGKCPEQDAGGARGHPRDASARRARSSVPRTRRPLVAGFAATLLHSNGERSRSPLELPPLAPRD